MSQADPTPDNNGQNIMELNEQPEAKQKQAIPPRKLREIKHVNYSKYFSEDPDNSEDYQPEESSQKPEPPKKRARPKSVTKGEASNKKKKTENQENNQNPENKMELEENKPQEEQINKEAENADKNNRNNNRAFWEEVGKLELLKPITTKFKPETLRKYWRTIREAKKYRKIISETRRYRNDLDNPNLKFLSSIKIICEYVTNASHKKIDYFLKKHLPPVKVKKITAEDMTPEQQINDILTTFIQCFPKKKEKEILETLYMTSFDIENTFLVLKDRDNLNFLLFTEKDDEIVSKSWEEKNETAEDYLDVINIKGLEEVLRRKEFLFGVKIDREEYNKAEEIAEEENNENNNNEQGEKKDENQNEDKDDKNKTNNDEKNEKEIKDENKDKEAEKDNKENKDKKEDEKKE